MREKISTTMHFLSKITVKFPSSIVMMTKTSTTKSIPFLRGQKWQQSRKCGFVTIGVVLVVGRVPSAVTGTTSKLTYRAHPGVAGKRWKQLLA